MKKTILFLVVMQSILGMLIVCTADAAIYRYTDKEGMPWYVDNPSAIPEQYRASSVIIDGDSKLSPEKQSVTIANETPVIPPKSEEVAVKPLSVRLLISLSVVAGIFLLYLFARNLPLLRGRNKALYILRSSLIGISSLFLIVTHAKDMMEVFYMAKQSVDEVQQQSEEKGKKAAQAIKTLDEIRKQAEQGPKE